MSGIRSRVRRLPVFLLIDDSAAMIGVNTVAASEGLQTFQRDLLAHPVAVRSVYLSVALLSPHGAATPLEPVSYLDIPTFQAKGDCLLAPALEHVQRTIVDEVNLDTAERPGDLHPLVIVVLSGSCNDELASLTSALDNLTHLDSARQPRMFVIAGDADDARVRALGGYLFTVAFADGNSVANVFAWAAAVVCSICDAQARGERSVDWPPAPAGIRRVQ